MVWSPHSICAMRDIILGRSSAQSQCTTTQCPSAAECTCTIKNDDSHMGEEYSRSDLVMSTLLKTHIEYIEKINCVDNGRSEFEI